MTKHPQTPWLVKSGNGYLVSIENNAPAPLMSTDKNEATKFGRRDAREVVKMVRGMGFNAISVRFAKESPEGAVKVDG